MDSQDIVLIKIGLRLQKLRVEKGFTSYEHFAIEHELSRMHYWQIEKGKINLTIKTLLKYLEIHEISIETFFNIEI
ncbi:MAG: helix-turn-helix transcriptional regulator [Flavobacteriia bacterium]|nr:helix-turn-helix transcriptional regulator [Flavobacteriia bacterium]